jgi:endo-1,4-beta-xylanase
VKLPTLPLKKNDNCHNHQTKTMKMKKLLSISVIFLSFVCCLAEAKKEQTLKDVLGQQLLIGTAVNTSVVWERNAAEAQIVKDNFNSIVAENCMKGMLIHPKENTYFWDDADQTVKFAQENGLTITGHCLVWHSQPPRWMFTDTNGQTVSRAVLIDRMYHHITDVVGRYRGKIKGWDVVNETVNDDGTMRQTPYYKIIGPDYIELAFKFAHEADPDAELYINDYSMSNPAKRETICRIVRDLKAKGCRVDAVGMQSHNGLDYPNLAEYEKSIDAFAACGVKVMMTELDLNMLPNPRSFGGADIGQNYAFDKKMNPYPEGLDKAGEKKFNDRYMALFEIYSRHRSQISRITFWGVSDGMSWLNNWPVRGRTNYPLLFDRNYKAKSVVKKIIKEWQAASSQQIDKTICHINQIP